MKEAEDLKLYEVIKFEQFALTGRLSEKIYDLDHLEIYSEMVSNHSEATPWSMTMMKRGT